MTALRHRTFVGPTSYSHGLSLNDNREVIRGLAAEFAAEVGVGNVVSVCEHAMSLGPFTVVVWYRGGADDGGGSAVRVTNAMIARRLRGEPVAAEPDPAPTGPGANGWVWAALAAVIAAAAAVLAVR